MVSEPALFWPQTWPYDSLIAVVVPCDHSFGWEASVDPPWPGFLPLPSPSNSVSESSLTEAAATCTAHSMRFAMLASSNYQAREPRR